MDKKKVAVPLVCHGHSRPVVDLFYSPVTSDGFFLISASKDSSPMLRNGESGDWIGTFEGHKGAVWSCCLDTNALRAASGSADFTAKVWDALTGDELHSFEHKHIVRACAFSEDAHLLLTGGVEKVLRIYDLNRPDAPPREVDKSPGSVRTVAWLHSDQTILSSCTDTGGISFGLVKSYNMPCTVESASLEPKYGDKFIAGGEDMWIHVFDFHTGEEIACNKGHHGPVHCLRFSPGGESYASGSEDGTIRIWQTGPLTHDDSEGFSANGSSGKVKVMAEEVSHKVEGFHIVGEGKTTEKEAARD
ncbi:serine-threonine kinase receptor-associated protein-like isoform X2 [Tripterygium wilfordii]|uniref:serine-threonine kinase receptor-associated protein-like isoform X2 n=1 Tax=Tripterygium wilfordii TaxID=458696 RepID=UPI0018F82CFE|nr:serine-threonine kinase receptor-associated protein-like isoform X2 [Tripterygium wilfordii]